MIYLERRYLEAMTRHGGRRKRGLNVGMRFARHAEIRSKVVARRLGAKATDIEPGGTGWSATGADMRTRNTGIWRGSSVLGAGGRRECVKEYFAQGCGQEWVRGGRNCPR